MNDDPRVHGSYRQLTLHGGPRSGDTIMVPVNHTLVIPQIPAEGDAKLWAHEYDARTGEYLGMVER